MLTFEFRICRQYVRGSQIAHLDMHHLVFGINFQIHSVSLTNLVLIHLLIHFSTHSADSQLSISATHVQLIH